MKNKNALSELKIKREREGERRQAEVEKSFI